MVLTTASQTMWATGNNGTILAFSTDPWGNFRTYSKTNGSWTLSTPSPEHRIKPSADQLFIAGTARTCYKVDYREGVVSYVVPTGVGSYHYTDWISSIFGHPGRNTIIQAKCNLNVGEAAARVRSKLRDESVNLAQALGEYAQTADLVASAIHDVRKLWSVFRGRWLVGGSSLKLRPMTSRWLKYFLSQGKDRKFAEREWQKLFANRWLQYIYGVKPLIMDVQGALKLLSKPNIAPKAIIRGTCNITKNADDSVELGKPSKWVPSGALITKVERRYHVHYQAIPQSNHLISTLASTGFTNPPALAWELLPFSFVVDWFVNVGEVLASLDDCALFSNAYYRISYKELYEQRVVSGGGTSRYTYVETTRGVGSALGRPSLRYEPSLSATRLTSAVALLRQSR